MDELRKLYIKLKKGDRTLTDKEAEAILDSLENDVLQKGRDFEKRGYRESISVASDFCPTCGKPGR